MNRGASLALIICGSCLVGITPLRSMLLDWRVVTALEE